MYDCFKAAAACCWWCCCSETWRKKHVLPLKVKGLPAAVQTTSRARIHHAGRFMGYRKRSGNCPLSKALPVAFYQPSIRCNVKVKTSSNQGHEYQWTRVQTSTPGTRLKWHQQPSRILGGLFSPGFARVLFGRSRVLAKAPLCCIQQ